jgi:hypothetical protein
VKRPIPSIRAHDGFSGRSVNGALGKVDGLAAPFANMFAVEFVGEDLHRLATVGAFADERLQGFVLFETGAMLRCRHGILLGRDSGDPATQAP